MKDLPFLERVIERWGLYAMSLMWSDGRFRRALGTLLALAAILVVGAVVLLSLVVDAICSKLKQLKRTVRG